MADNSNKKIKKGSVYEKFTDPFYLNTFIEFYHTHSNEECQAEYNITHSTMYRIIKQFDIPTRTKEELDQINLRLYGVTQCAIFKGMPLSAIAFAPLTALSQFPLV